MVARGNGFVFILTIPFGLFSPGKRSLRDKGLSVQAIHDNDWPVVVDEPAKSLRNNDLLLFDWRADHSPMSREIRITKFAACRQQHNDHDSICCGHPAWAVCSESRLHSYMVTYYSTELS